MALIDCPECKREVSTRAAVCPHCGCPIGQQPPPKPMHSQPPRVQTIEQTGKQIKLVMLLSFLTMLGGCAGVMCSAPMTDGQPTDTGYYKLLVVGGLVVFISARFQQWWEHG